MKILKLLVLSLMFCFYTCIPIFVYVGNYDIKSKIIAIITSISIGMFFAFIGMMLTPYDKLK